MCNRNPPAFICVLYFQRLVENPPCSARSELAAGLGEKLTSLSVQNTSLDDVFVHYTGRQLRDEQVKSVFMMPPRPGRVQAMNRMFAIVEREMRKFFRSPVLMIMSMMLPIVQLIILGHALGGHVTGCARCGRR